MPEVKELWSETAALKEVVADLTLENRLLNKSMTGGRAFFRHWSVDNGERVRGMRHAASEKPEIIRTVEALHLSVRDTLAMLGIPSTTYSRRSDRWSERGLEEMEDATPHPRSVWNRLPDETQADIIDVCPRARRADTPGTGDKVHR